MAAHSRETKPCRLRFQRFDPFSTQPHWWSGPKSLSLDHDDSHKSSRENHDSTSEREWPGITLVIKLNKAQTWDLITRFSSLQHLIRITTICNRVINRLIKSDKSLIERLLDTFDLQNATHYWIHATQQIFMSHIHSTSYPRITLSQTPILS